MAKVVTNNPWTMDAAGDFEGNANLGEATAPVFGVKPYIDQIKVATGAGGDVQINTSNGGDEIVFLDNTPANDVIWVPLGQYFDGIYIQTLPATAVVYIYHGRSAGDA